MIRDLELLRTEDFKNKVTQCIHCGLCLRACPTYAVFGTEMDGPRGRIALMGAASEGKVGLEDFLPKTLKAIEIAGGLGKLAGRIWRIGLMGYSSREENIRLLAAALKEVMAA